MTRDVGTGHLCHFVSGLLYGSSMVLGLCSIAPAQIVHYEWQHVTISSANPVIPIDLTNNGAADLLFEYQSGTVSGANVRAVGLKSLSGGVIGYTQDIFGNTVPMASALAANHGISSTEVDSAAFCVRVALGFIVNTYGQPPWRQGGSFFGFSFQMSDGVNPPTTHYGWGRASATAACAAATFTEIAYQTTPNAMILAGDVGALPVELMAFEAFTRGRDVTLRWSTASEAKNAGFEVQRKVGDVFEAVGFVEGAGNSIDARHYAYQVPHLLPGAHHFRLKQIDVDGTFAFSHEIEATVDVPDAFLLTGAYPNPFNPRTRFSLSAAQSQEVSVGVYDVLGRQAAMLFRGVIEGGTAHEFELDGSMLPSGTYLIRVLGETFSGTQFVTLSK